MLTFRNMTIQDRDLVLPMVETFYQSDAVDHPVEREILGAVLPGRCGPQRTPAPGNPGVPGPGAGRIYLCDPVLLRRGGGQVRFYRGDIFSRPLPGTGVGGRLWPGWSGNTPLPGVSAWR